MSSKFFQNKSIKTHSTYLLSIVHTLIFITNANAKTPLELNGFYEYRTDRESKEILGDIVCFYPDKATTHLIPRDKKDLRSAWFCFINHQEAKRLLKINPSKISSNKCGVTGTAHIFVAGYTVYTEEGDGFDTAKLLSVSHTTPSQEIKCN